MRRRFVSSSSASLWGPGGRQRCELMHDVRRGRRAHGSFEIGGVACIDHHRRGTQPCELVHLRWGARRCHDAGPSRHKCAHQSPADGSRSTCHEDRDRLHLTTGRPGLLQMTRFNVEPAGPPIRSRRHASRVVTAGLARPPPVPGGTRCCRRASASARTAADHRVRPQWRSSP